MPKSSISGVPQDHSPAPHSSIPAAQRKHRESQRWNGTLQGTKENGDFTRPGKRLHNELERSTILNGKINYFYGYVQ